MVRREAGLGGNPVILYWARTGEVVVMKDEVAILVY